MLCPQAVRTGMTAENAATKAAAGDGMMEASEVAEIVIEGLQHESFLILPHPEVEAYMQRKSADYDRWIKGMNRLHCSLSPQD
jgi:short-subunit dehydrogenase